MLSVVDVELRRDQKAPELVVAVDAGKVRLLNPEFVM
jgi:hypothetical protein